MYFYLLSFEPLLELIISIITKLQTPIQIYKHANAKSSSSRTEQSTDCNTMVLGWRRAFCTSIPKDQERDSPILKDKSNPAGFISNPSTPRLLSQPVSSPSLRCSTTASAPQTPKLHCKTKNSPGFFNRSTPSSPRSPSTLSLLKSTLRISKVLFLFNHHFNFKQ